MPLDSVAQPFVFYQDEQKKRSTFIKRRSLFLQDRSKFGLFLPHSFAGRGSFA
jgi:hypothetical protein